MGLTVKNFLIQSAPPKIPEHVRLAGREKDGITNFVILSGNVLSKYESGTIHF